MPESNWNFESSNEIPRTKYQFSPKNTIFLGVKIYILFCTIHLLTDKAHAFVSLLMTATILILKTRYSKSVLSNIINTIGWAINGILNVVSTFLLIACFVYITDKTKILDLVSFTK